MKSIPVLFSLLFSALSAHENHPMAGMEKPTQEASPSSPLEFNGSGTSRLPEATPMYAIHSDLAGWDMMTYGSLYLRYTNRNANNSGKRGAMSAWWTGRTRAGTDGDHAPFFRPDQSGCRHQTPQPGCHPYHIRGGHPGKDESSPKD